VVLQVRSQSGINLEQWAAERAGEVFREVYGRDVTVMRAKAK
jgi:hypothetical protein